MNRPAISPRTGTVCPQSAHEALKRHGPTFLKNTVNHRHCEWSGLVYCECTVNDCHSTLAVTSATWERWLAEAAVLSAEVLT